MRRALLVSVLIAIAVGWGSAIAAAPVVRSPAGHTIVTRVAALTYAVGALICHQRPERSFHLAGVQLPVCARCAALYWGGALGLLGWVLIRSRIRGEGMRWVGDRSSVAAGVLGGHHFERADGGHHFRGRGNARAALTRAQFRRALIVFGAPTAISVATAAAGVWDPSNLLRAAISAPLGVVLGGLLSAVTLEDLR